MPDHRNILPRLAGHAVTAALDVMPVVVLMGARQTGKSTLVRTLPELADRPYLTLDDFDILAQARSDPEDLINRAPRLTIDEVQREPDTILAIKRAIDERRPREPGRFALTGSANLLLMERISETLAGRASYVSLWPLTRRERLGLGTAGIWSEFLSTPVDDWFELVREGKAQPADWRKLAIRGGYPTPAYELGAPEAREEWFRGYVQTYLERDLQTLSAIDNLVDFRRLMRASALRVGGLLNRAEIGRDTGISRPTVHRYLNLLETSYQLIFLEPYSVNRTKRLVKSPRVFWGDTGLAMHLADERDPRGAHLENLVLLDLIAWRDTRTTRPQVLYWRTQTGEEVDFVIESAGRLLPIEVKATARPKTSQAKHLKIFRDQYPEATPGGLLLHDGDDVFWAAQHILAVPWWRVI